MTKEQIEAIRERAEKATEGPWEQIEEIDGIYSGRKTVVRTTAPYTRWTSRIVSVGQTRRHISEDAEDNTNFIANARQDVPALLAEVERLQKVADLYESYRGDVDYAMHKVGRNNDRISEAEEKLAEGLLELNGGDA